MKVSPGITQHLRFPLLAGGLLLGLSGCVIAVNHGSPPPDVSVTEQSGPVSDLDARFSAAAAISNWQTRDAALIQVAIDASKVGDADISLRAVKKISDWQRRDSTAQTSALNLKQHDLRQDAITMAHLISNWQTRDETLNKLSQ